MIGKKENTVYGLDKQEAEELLAWLHHDEAKYLWRVLDNMAASADKQALQTPKSGQDWLGYTGNQQRFIGEGIAFRKVANIKEAL